MLAGGPAGAAEGPARDEAIQALRKAVAFYHKVEPASGIIDSATFAANVKVLAQFLAAAK